MNGGISYDLCLLASVCIRQRLKVHNLCVLTMLYRRGEMYVSEIEKFSGISQSDVYARLNYLESKRLVRRRMLDDERLKAIYVWSLTGEGKRLVRDYEMCYARLREALRDRW